MRSGRCPAAPRGAICQSYTLWPLPRWPPRAWPACGIGKSFLCAYICLCGRAALKVDVDSRDVTLDRRLRQKFSLCEVRSREVDLGIEAGVIRPRLEIASR